MHTQDSPRPHTKPARGHPTHSLTSHSMHATPSRGEEVTSLPLCARVWGRSPPLLQPEAQGRSGEKPRAGFGPTPPSRGPPPASPGPHGPSLRNLVVACSALAAMTKALRVACTARRSSRGSRPGRSARQVVEHTPHTQGLCAALPCAQEAPPPCARSSSP